MVCISSVTEKEALHPVHKRDGILFIGSASLLPDFTMTYSRPGLLPGELCDICVLDPGDPHTIRLSISCPLKGQCDSSTWL